MLHHARLPADALIFDEFGVHRLTPMDTTPHGGEWGQLHDEEERTEAVASTDATGKISEATRNSQAEHGGPAKPIQPQSSAPVASSTGRGARTKGEQLRLAATRILRQRLAEDSAAVRH